MVVVISLLTTTTRVSQNLVYACMNLIDENQLDIKKQNGIYGGIDFNNIPF
jgi:hypothetical protein